MNRPYGWGRVWAVAAWATVAAVAMASCTDEAKKASPTPPAPPLTKEAFVERADAVCQRVNDQVRGPARQLFASITPDIQKAAELVPAMVAPLRSGVAELRQLRPPVDDQTAINSIFSELETAISRLEAAGVAARAGDSAATTNAIAEWGERVSMVKELQRDYGFKVCGASVDDVPAPPNLSPERRSFIERGDALCAAADAEADPALADTFSGDPVRAAAGLAKVITIYTGLMDSLDQLTPPEGDAEEIDSMLDRWRKALQRASDAQRLAAAGQTEAYEEKLREADRQFLRPAELAFRRYGFVRCGGSGV